MLIEGIVDGALAASAAVWWWRAAITIPRLARA
jgi:hypothetical protein